MKPKRLGRYELLEEIGSGAMGIVYLAFDPQIKRKIAVKAFRLEQMVDSTEQEEFKVRFQREGQLAGNLSHPNIIAIHDVGEEEGISFIAMELAEGESLAEKMGQKYTFSIKEVVDIFTQICQGMEYAHQQGIIHRDLKPSNILIRKDGLLKIADFGIARALGSTITGSHKTLGTPAYMSPEQITGGRIDRRSDIFSMGIILYQMLTGERPFAGEITSTVIYRIINEEPIPPRKINIQVPPAFNLIVMKALSKDPAERYQTCQELLNDIKNYKSLKPAETLPTLALADDKGKTPPHAAKGKPLRRSWIMIAALFAVIVIAAYFLYDMKFKERAIEESTQLSNRIGKEITESTSDKLEDGAAKKDIQPPHKEEKAKEVDKNLLGSKAKPSSSMLPSTGEEGKRSKTETTIQIDSALIFAFGPMPPGKYILRIDGKKVQEESFLSLSFLNLLQKNSPKLFFALRKKVLELGKLQRYRNIYRKRVPVSAGMHDISVSFILFIPQIKTAAEKGKKALVNRVEFERKINGQFAAGKGRVLFLRRLQGDISLQWMTQEQYRALAFKKK